jgi:hypothetical protein
LLTACDEAFEDSIRVSKKVYDSLRNTTLKLNAYRGKSNEIKKAENHNKSIDDLKRSVYTKYADQLRKYYDYAKNNNKILSQIVWASYLNPTKDFY